MRCGLSFRKPCWCLSGRSDFNIQHGETRPPRSQEEALRPACLKEAVGGWLEGEGGSTGSSRRRRLLHSSPLLQRFQHGGIVKRERAGRSLVIGVGF